MLLFQDKISISCYKMQILSLALPSSWKIVWRCLSNCGASCLFLLLPVSHKPKNETESSPWHSVVMALMEERGKCHCTLPAPPRCPCEAEGAAAERRQSDPAALRGKAFTLSALGWGRNG